MIPAGSHVFSVYTIMIPAGNFIMKYKLNLRNGNTPTTP